MQDLFIESVLSVNRELFNLIKNGLSDFHFVYHDIGFGGDVSSKIDLVAEDMFVKKLLQFGQIYSEESGIIGDGEYKIVIDPIDGSHNLLSGFPYFGTSVSLEKDGKSFVGIICNLANGDIFIKTKEYFKVGNLFTNVYKDETSTDFTKISIFEKSYANEKLTQKLIESSIKFRSPGALALSLAYAHRVGFLLFNGKLREFDVNAGLFMCEDLNIYKKDKLLLISKDLNLFNNILQLVTE
ncbi:MAG: inositol monophosphatase [Campylobacterales bacterium]|nr:inositol monophosphatase [Campylobacterales bacterium]